MTPSIETHPQRKLLFAVSHLTALALCGLCAAAPVDSARVEHAGTSTILSANKTLDLNPVDVQVADAPDPIPAPPDEPPNLTETVAVPAPPPPPRSNVVPPLADIEASQPLGTPNGLFSTGAMDATPTQPATDSLARATPTSRWRMFNPRENEIARVGLALGAVLVLLFSLRGLIRRMAGTAAGRPGGVIEVLARYPVSRGQQLQLIRLGRRVLLVFQNGSSMNTLTELTDQHEVAMLLAKIESASRGKDAERFREMLAEHQTLQAGRTARLTSDHDERAALNGEQTMGNGTIIDLTKTRRRWRLTG